MGGSGGRTADIGVDESARGIVQVVAFDFLMIDHLKCLISYIELSSASSLFRCCLDLRIARVDSLSTGKEKNLPGDPPANW